MSHVHSTPEHSPPRSDHPAPPDLAALAATLQEAAQALLTLTLPDMTDEPKEPTVRRDAGPDAGLPAGPSAKQPAGPSLKPLSEPPANPPISPDAGLPAAPAACPFAAPPVDPPACPSAESSANPLAALPSRQADGEVRSFYFPPAAVRMERDLLSKYRAEDFQGLLEEAHTLLVGLVKVMRSVHKDVRVKGYVISSLGAQIDHASALVLRMRNVYDKVMPVRR